MELANFCALLKLENVPARAVRIHPRRKMTLSLVPAFAIPIPRLEFMPSPKKVLQLRFGI